MDAKTNQGISALRERDRLRRERWERNAERAARREARALTDRATSRDPARRETIKAPDRDF